MTTFLLTHSAPSRARSFGETPLAGLEALGTVRLHEGSEPLSAGELIAAARGCDVIVSDRSTPAEAGVFDALPDLAAMVRVAVDIRNIDVDAATRNGVLVTHASAGFMASVAELTIGYMIDLARRVTDATIAYRQGVEPAAVMGRQLEGGAIGIVGYGEIGRKLAGLALVLGMRVRVTDPRAERVAPGVEVTDFETLLASSDFVVCLATANPTTEKLFDAAAFSRMRRDACFINVSRGMLVDEAALLSALDGDLIAGAAMDVGSAPDEMPAPSLARHPRVIATPHIGGLTPEAISHQSDEAVRQCAEILAGRPPVGAVNGPQAHRLSKFRSDADGDRP